jgi:putative transposase
MAYVPLETELAHYVAKGTYLYRVVDTAGQTIDFRFSRTRDVAAVKAFFKKAIRQEGRSPNTITLDGYAASH